MFTAFAFCCCNYMADNARFSDISIMKWIVESKQTGYNKNTTRHISQEKFLQIAKLHLKFHTVSKRKEKVSGEHGIEKCSKSDRQGRTV